MASVSPVTVVCPSCNTSFALDETLAGPVIARVRAEAQSEIADLRKQAESDMDAERLRAKNRETELRKEFEDKHESFLDDLRTEAETKATAGAERKVKALTDETDELRKKVADAEGEQLKLEKEKRDFEAEKRRFDLEKLRAVNEAVTGAQKEVESRLKADWEQERKQNEIQNQRLQAQIAELQRRAEQKPSQELQGEAFEVLFEERLCGEFRADVIECVKKGQRGADLKHHVNAIVGDGDGTILWECKKAHAWGGEWGEKAKQDGREARAHAVVIVSAVLPKGIDHFGEHEGTWVCHPTHAVGLARVLRSNLVDVSRARFAAAGRESRAQDLWDYVTGPVFKARVEDTMAAYDVLKRLHEDDMRATKKRWSKEEQALNRMLDSLYGAAGTIDGLTGTQIGELEAAELPALEAAEAETSLPERNGVTEPLDDIDWDAALAE